ncbi:hypothetical protein A1I_04205 [Rickettsia bellii OSU 85-389]|uniref:hypothetical protein n=1 Tax=Rickettsia bellii TaxID=33990 RepID=UPI0000DB0F2C|nr:hypothetical protein [Rickettsia bellii]ABV79191.1 hypothetical protein A1I_04205 [Rickettsia bellii OSU 85-389]
MSSIDKAFFIKDLAVRIKQTSDVKTVNKFYQIEKTFNKTLTVIDAYSKNLAQERKKAFEEVIRDYENGDSEVNILENLLSSHKKSISLLDNGLTEEHQKLAGLIMESTRE